MNIRGGKKIKYIYVLQYENSKSKFGQDDKGLNTFHKYRLAREIKTSSIWNDKCRDHNTDSLQVFTLVSMIEKERGKWYEASEYLGG